jgi:hypothetical protein
MSATHNWDSSAFRDVPIFKPELVLGSQRLAFGHHPGKDFFKKLMRTVAIGISPTPYNSDGYKV